MLLATQAVLLARDRPFNVLGAPGPALLARGLGVSAVEARSIAGEALEEPPPPPLPAFGLAAPPFLSACCARKTSHADLPPPPSAFGFSSGVSALLSRSSFFAAALDSRLFTSVLAAFVTD